MRRKEAIASARTSRKKIRIQPKSITQRTDNVCAYLY